MINVNLSHPSNSKVLRYLQRNLEDESRLVEALQGIAPGQVENPYYRLGTHPDLVERLWDEITISLPEKCQWVICSTPVLVHPKTGIIFAFAGGTHTYALRLPKSLLQEALTASPQRSRQFSDGSVFNLDEIGTDWVFGSWHKDEIAWSLAAYQHAGSF